MSRTCDRLQKCQPANITSTGAPGVPRALPVVGWLQHLFHFRHTSGSCRCPGAHRNGVLYFAKSLVLQHGHDQMRFTKLQANKQISILEEVDILQDRLGIWMELLVIGIPWRVWSSSATMGSTSPNPLSYKSTHKNFLSWQSKHLMYTSCRKLLSRMFE